MFPHLAAPKVLSWANPETTEAEAIEQCARIARLEFVTPYIAVMPDVHVGKGACVGTAIPTVGALVPAAVGVDIGCGMMAVRTDLVRSAFEGRDLGALRLEIERSIPTVGRMPVYNASVEASAEPRLAELEMLATRLGVRPESYDGKWTYQLGSLGGGNHFIELVTDRPPVAVRLAGRDDYRVRVGNYRVVYAIDDEAVRAGGAVRMASGGVPAGARTRTRIRAFLWRHLPAQRGRSTPAEVANDDNARDLSRRLSQSRQPAASRMHPP